MPALKAKFCLQSPLQRGEEMIAKVGHTTGDNGVHIHFTMKFKTGRFHEEAALPGLEGRNDGKMMSRNWAGETALVSWLGRHSAVTCTQPGTGYLPLSPAHTQVPVIVPWSYGSCQGQHTAHPQQWQQHRDGWAVGGGSRAQAAPSAQAVTSSVPPLPTLTESRLLSSCCSTDVLTGTNQALSLQTELQSLVITRHY